MTGSIYGYTSAVRFKLINYNSAGWHQYEYQNWRALDALLDTYFRVLNFQGEWDNAVAYSANDLASDPDAGTTDPKLYRALLTHTSAAAGTFAADRLANPTYWEAVDQSIFDASSNRLIVKLRKQLQDAHGIVAAARQAHLLSIESVTAAANSADAAAVSAMQARGTAQQALVIQDQARRAQRLINQFNPANIAFYGQVFGMR